LKSYRPNFPGEFSLSVYVDRRFKNYKASNLSQFERVMKELGIGVIHARSPQAKGRIERVFGTLQNGLVKELRLAGVKEPAAANRFLEEVFLPRYNARFNVVPAKQKNLHYELTPYEKAIMASILARKTFRHVNNDFTVRHNNCWYQLEEKQPVSVRPGGDDVLVFYFFFLIFFASFGYNFFAWEKSSGVLTICQKVAFMVRIGKSFARETRVWGRPYSGWPGFIFCSG